MTKHHGLGNDFLVLLDADGDAPVAPELVRVVCDRHRGIGADGFLRATPTPSEGVDARMELFNADGSVAEMSGNGIRCLAQALLLEGWTARKDQVVIATHAGVRTLSVVDMVDDAPRSSAPSGQHGVADTAGAGSADGSALSAGSAGGADDAEGGAPSGGRSAVGTAAALPRTMVLAVEMGAARIGDEAAEWIGGGVRRAMWADMGNPHLVAEVAGVGDGGGHQPSAGRNGASVNGAPSGGVDGSMLGDAPDGSGLAAISEGELVALGEQVNAAVPSGANVHLLVAGPGDVIAMRTYERGVGLTEACGTGACASAAVAHQWGLVGPSVTVDMPGGRALVQVGPTVTLTGPATVVAAVDYPWP